MRLSLLAFCAGVLWLQTSAQLPSCQWIATLAASALALALVPITVARTAAGALAGYCWAAWLASAAMGGQLDPAHEGRDLQVIGTVSGLPGVSAQGTRFLLDVERYSTAMPQPPRRISLGWYRDRGPVPDLRPGQRWQLTVRLQRPHGTANPGAFDVEAWWLEQGVRATGYVRANGSHRMLAPFVATPAHLLQRTRYRLRARIQDALHDAPYAGVIVALVVGDQRAIDRDDWTVFNRTGIGHLISISGLHVTMIAGLCGWLVAAGWRRSFWTDARLPLVLPAQKAGAIAALLAATGYVALAGFGVPAQRTLYMLAVIAVALWLGRLASLSHVLLLALACVLVLDPWAVLAPGFWLSFGAVAAILYAHAGRTGRPLGWRGMLREAALTQYAVTVGLVPLTLLLFAQTSLVSPVANALAIPVISLLVTPAALVGTLLPDPLGGLLLVAGHWCVQQLALVLHALAAGPLAVWSTPAPQAWCFLLACAGTLWLLAPRGWPARWAGLVAWLPLLGAAPRTPDQGEFTATVLDVGQGAAVVVETRQHRLLVDTGPAYSPTADAGSRVVLPYLQWRGIGRLDGVVVSHEDSDHAGGAASVLRGLEVGWLAAALPQAHPLTQRTSRWVPCAAGQRWTWDGVQFEFLHPQPGSDAGDGIKPNARSCVLRVSNGRHAMLLPADVEAGQELQLLGAARTLRADVLLAPHHGSGTSSTPDFIDAVAPRLVIYQVGYRNRYRHPRADVQARYAARRVPSLRTDTSGAITLHSSEGLVPRAYRTEHARYWHPRPD
jgi:competence protein ComEC